MKEYPLVSVIIPTHNRYDTLFRAIDSVHNQSYLNVEIIVVDDNYENQELRKKVKKGIDELPYQVDSLFPNKHVGSAEARNIGIDYSSGKYLSFLDDDDVYYIDKIKKQLEFLLNSNNDKLALVYCYGRIIYPDGSIEFERTCERGICLSRHMQNNIAGTSFWLCKKEVIDSVGRFVGIGAHDDGIVILKLMSEGYNVDLVQEDLVDYFVHDYQSGITGVTEKTLLADEKYFYICNNYFHMLNKSEVKAVINHYYDDRNWNLIILKKNYLCKRDILKMKAEGVSIFTIIKCGFRYLFRKHIINRENNRLKKKGMI